MYIHNYDNIIGHTQAIHYKKYTTASDVWSFGCVMYEIWSVGHKPFEGLTNTEVYNTITQAFVNTCEFAYN